MPNDHERRRLDEIEAALRASDPELDRLLRTFQPRRTGLKACAFGGRLAAALFGLTPWWIVTLVMLGPLLALTGVVWRPRWRVTPTPASPEAPTG